MKTNILSLLALTGILFLTAACASDTPSNNPTNPQEPDLKGLTSFVEVDTATRTTANYDGSGLDFFWTEGDRLWVYINSPISPRWERDARNTINEKLENHPTIPDAVKRAATAEFYFNGDFTEQSYPVRYTGKSYAFGKYVTIKGGQSQHTPTDASHIGEDGDFGIATATRPIGGGKYYFTLEHKASYITFMPYTSNGVISAALLQKIRVYTKNTSDVLAGTFEIADDGTLTNYSSVSNSITLDTKSTPWSYDGLPLPNAPSYTTNAVTMVIKPGTYHDVSIDYTLYDPVTHITGTITKTYPILTFTAGKNKKVTTDLQVREVQGSSYYMWDAQQQYWYGHEWNKPGHVAGVDQATVRYVQGSAYPKDNTDPRWYREDASLPAPAANNSAKDCPNVNECYWYAKHGDPHADYSLWALMGHLYEGGVLLKKKSKIPGFRSDKAPDGIDYTVSTTPLDFENTYPSTPIDDINDYFFLPYSAQYSENGILINIGNYGSYWSSTPSPNNTKGAYRLDVNMTSVRVHVTSRNFGLPLFIAE